MIAESYLRAIAVTGASHVGGPNSIEDFVE